MDELEAIKTKLTEERNDVANVVRKEFAANLDKLTEENTKLSAELQSQVVASRAALLEKDLNLRSAQSDFEKNINQLHEKVQGSIEKKEQVIQELKTQHEMAVEKIHQLEEIISQQSVDMLKGNIGGKSIEKTIGRQNDESRSFRKK